MSQGKLNAIPPGTGGVAGQLANSKTADAIAQQGQASMQQTPPMGTMPGTFGRPGQSVQQPGIGQFDSIGVAAPVPMMGGGLSQDQLNMMYGMGGGIKQPGGTFGGDMMSGLFNPGGVNTPAPEDELDGIGGPDSQDGGY